MDNFENFIGEKIVWTVQSDEKINILKDIHTFNRLYKNNTPFLLFNDETKEEIYEYCLYCLDSENLTVVYSPEESKIKYSVLKNLYKGIVIVEGEIVHITPPKIFIITNHLPEYKFISSKKIYINN